MRRSRAIEPLGAERDGSAQWDIGDGGSEWLTANTTTTTNNNSNTAHHH